MKLLHLGAQCDGSVLATLASGKGAPYTGIPWTVYTGCTVYGYTPLILIEKHTVSSEKKTVRIQILHETTFEEETYSEFIAFEYINIGRIYDWRQNCHNIPTNMTYTFASYAVGTTWRWRYYLNTLWVCELILTLVKILKELIGHGLSETSFI